MTTLTVEQSLFASTITDAALEQTLCEVLDSSSMGRIPDCLVSSAVASRLIGNASRLIGNVTVYPYGLFEVIEDAVHDYLRRTDKFVSVRGRRGGIYRNGGHYKANWENWEKAQKEDAERKEAARLAAKLKAEKEEEYAAFMRFMGWNEEVRSEREMDGFDEVVG